jgi:hypothetical protein
MKWILYGIMLFCLVMFVIDVAEGPNGSSHSTPSATWVHDGNGNPVAVETREQKISGMGSAERGCLVIWLKTSDEKISSLTVQQTRQIHLCESLGLYHDVH